MFIQDWQQETFKLVFACPYWISTIQQTTEASTPAQHGCQHGAHGVWRAHLLDRMFSHRLLPVEYLQPKLQWWTNPAYELRVYECVPTTYLRVATSVCGCDIPGTRRAGECAAGSQVPGTGWCRVCVVDERASVPKHFFYYPRGDRDRLLRCLPLSCFLPHHSFEHVFLNVIFER